MFEPVYKNMIANFFFFNNWHKPFFKSFILGPFFDNCISEQVDEHCLELCGKGRPSPPLWKLDFRASILIRSLEYFSTISSIMQRSQTLSVSWIMQQKLVFNSAVLNVISEPLIIISVSNTMNLSQINLKRLDSLSKWGIIIIIQSGIGKFPG